MNDQFNEKNWYKTQLKFQMRVHEGHEEPQRPQRISLRDRGANLVGVVILHLFRGITPNACCKNFLLLEPVLGFNVHLLFKFSAISHF
jgi:hypothetical protein